MKLYIYLVFVFIMASCAGNQKSSQIISSETKVLTRKQNLNFQHILDSLDVIGSVLLYDLENDSYHSNNFDWAEKGHLPASTFKIVNSMIGLETGVIANDSTIFEWNGEGRMSSMWEKDLVLGDAFQFSCVPCYQEIARSIGVERMKDYVNRLNYGNILVNTNSIDNFWLIGGSRISQVQQISFLKRFYLSKLPISKRTENIVRDLMVMDNNDQYNLSGKSGLSNENDHYNGWFVGFLEVDNRTLFFATNIEPKNQRRRKGFTSKRKKITMMALNEVIPFEMQR